LTINVCVFLFFHLHLEATFVVGGGALLVESVVEENPILPEAVLEWEATALVIDPECSGTGPLLTFPVLTGDVMTVMGNAVERPEADDGR
jgi:hypothetical protein